MRPIKSNLLLAIPLAFTLALGTLPRDAAAQSCSKPKKGCVVKKDLKKDAVDSSRVKNNSLKSKDIKDGTLTGGDFKARTLTGTQFQNGGLTGSDIEDGSIGATALAPNLDRDLMADLACGEDQVARFFDGAWDCVTGGAGYVFVSSVAHEGDFRESQWDGVCQADAMAAGLPAGTYEAWLSTSLTDAKDMLPPGPFYLPPDSAAPNPSGNLVALSKADLLDSIILRALDIEADGTALAAQNNVWTGTAPNGTRTANTCSDWTQTTGNATAGVTTGTGAAWTNLNLGCFQSGRVYCFQVE